MIHNVVEGEPGIFPDPVARVLRAIGGIFNRKPKAEPAPEPEPPDDKPDP